MLIIWIQKSLDVKITLHKESYFVADERHSYIQILRYWYVEVDLLN